MADSENERKKIELEHDSYSQLLQALILVLVTIGVYLLGQVQNSKDPNTIYYAFGIILSFAFSLLVVFNGIILPYVRRKLDKIKNGRRSKGQAIPSLIIIIVFFAGIFLVLTTFSSIPAIIGNLSHIPYIRNIYTTNNIFTATNSFSYGQNFFLNFVIGDPTGNSLTPMLSLSYDKKCVASSYNLIPNTLFTITSPAINPNSENTYAFNFTVVNNGCNSSTSKIGLTLFYPNISKIVDYKEVSFNIIQIYPNTTINPAHS